MTHGMCICTCSVQGNWIDVLSIQAPASSTAPLGQVKDIHGEVYMLSYKSVLFYYFFLSLGDTVYYLVQKSFSESLRSAFRLFIFYKVS